MIESSATLVVSGDMSDERIYEITLEIARDLRASGIEAVQAKTATQAGDRGEAFSLGQLALVFLTGGAATALINCLRSYLLRDDTLKLKMTTLAGGSISIDAKNIDTDEIRNLIASIRSDKNG